MSDAATGNRFPHRVGCAVLLRRQAQQHGQTISELADAIVTHCGHHRLRAHRLACGWTLDQLISHMISRTGTGHKLGTSRVSRWERGEEQPSNSYRDALCQVYGTGPVELGLSTDYTPPPESTASDSTPTKTALPIDLPRQRTIAGEDSAIPDDRNVERAEHLRRRVDQTLAASTLADATISHKEAVAEEYGRTYKTQPAAAFLDSLLADLEDVHILTDRILPSAQRRDLCAVTARMAGLVSMTMVNLGRYRQAREWVHTARLAADEAGEPHLRAWTATRAAVASLHLGDPQGAATAAQEAELLTRHRPADITAMAWAILARAAATMHQPAAARAALHHAENIFTQTSSSTSVNTAYTFTAGQLHFYRSHALTTIGETDAAWRAQDDALATFGPGEKLDPTLVHLDRALCMVTAGDIPGGVDHASQVLLNLPVAYRPTIVLRRGHAVATAVPEHRRALPAVRALHEALAIDAGR
ncbi:helix-turn-helix transcriptional regulator [Actinoplanes sp. NPDC051861]|uniref:helix-turn-helix domain-containing protein n=1 Tax=Actinoplanes sp. NPDC051861 TaxID=3155170 RepID=UPI0034476B6B